MIILNYHLSFYKLFIYLYYYKYLPTHFTKPKILFNYRNGLKKSIGCRHNIFKML